MWNLFGIKKIPGNLSEQLKKEHIVSSFRTIPLVLEFHQIVPFGSRTLPPVGNRTPPWNRLH